MSNEEISDLKETFLAIDKNGDGMLSKEELSETMNKLSGETAINIEKILAKIDEDGNGAISYSEFLTAAVNWEKELSRDRLHAAFREFDKDGNGTISVAELTDALGGAKDQRHMFVQMVQEADTNSDGVLDLNEFVRFMEKVKVPNQV